MKWPEDILHVKTGYIVLALMAVVLEAGVDVLLLGNLDPVGSVIVCDDR